MLLDKLSRTRLKTQARMKTGLYIAELDGDRRIGRVLYRLKRKAGD
jgi:hypothetical protein